MFSVKNLVKKFPVGDKQLTAVGGVSFQIAKGETLGLVGESGSGKTTVGRCMLRLIEPTSGDIMYRDQNLTSMKPKDFRKIRPKINMVFQDPYDSLNPKMKIIDIVEEPLILRGGMTKAEIRKRALSSLERVHLHQRFALYPNQLTGGEQQRVGVARAIVTDPELIVLDEPTSLLDISVRADIINLLNQLQDDLQLSYLFISHDLMAVRKISDRIAIMYLSKIIETGAADTIFEESRHPYSRALLSAVLHPDPKYKPQRFRLKGEIPSAIELPKGCYLASRCALATDECFNASPALKHVGGDHYVACFSTGSR